MWGQCRWFFVHFDTFPIAIYNTYMPRNIFTWFTLCGVQLWSTSDPFYPYPSGLHHWHWGNRMIAPVSVKQPWSLWVNMSHESTKDNDVAKIKNAQQHHVHISWDIVCRHATSPCEHGDLRFLHSFFVLSPYSQLSLYFTHFPEQILICTKPV